MRRDTAAGSRRKSAWRLWRRGATSAACLAYWRWVDISAALPYLNATLRGSIYNRAANALTWKKGGHSLAFHAYEIATSNVEDREAAG